MLQLDSHVQSFDNLQMLVVCPHCQQENDTPTASGMYACGLCGRHFQLAHEPQIRAAAPKPPLPVITPPPVSFVKHDRPRRQASGISGSTACAIIAGAATVGVGLFVVFLVTRPSHSAKTGGGTPTTIASSLTEATRRLELRGYGYSKKYKLMGEDNIEYVRDASGAVHTVTIVRWAGDSRIKNLIFDCRTSEALRNSTGSYERLWDRIDADVIAMIGDGDYYRRAIADSKEADGDGLPRHEGRATTADGWQIQVVAYLGYIKNPGPDANNKLPFAIVDVRNVQIDEDIPQSAIREHDRQVKEAKAKWEREMKELTDGTGNRGTRSE